MRKFTIPDLLTFNGGYVDAAGFLALQGLFTAHVTGNFVTVGASLVQGSAGIVAKLLALPVFCLVVALVRYVYVARNVVEARAPHGLILLKLALFIAAAAMALAWGPFAKGDHFESILTGMTLVAAMAIQNVVHRVYYPKAPPTTLMTGSTTQAMLDVADLIRGGQAPEARAATRARCLTLSRAVLIFAIGCALAALAYAKLDCKAFLLPPVVVALGFLPYFHGKE
jgi:uncharacterized membrane protein YoaK (UPF0700 family)